MKKFTQFLILLTISLSVKAQTYYMCSTPSTSSLTAGTIYDSGGPSGNYNNNQNCFFLITAPCPGNITLNFTYFSTELNYDYLRVYDGTSTSAPLLGGYWGTGQVPQMVATSGNMLLHFYSDGTATMGGFEANWQFAGNGCPPVANFSTNINSCQGKVTFSDGTTQNPTSWLWNFGDGNASTLQNPVHTYTAAGTYPVNLVTTNSFGTNSITKNVTVNPMVFKIGYIGSPIANSVMSFTTDNTSGQVYTWQFGDGGVAGTVNANHIYTSMGTYTAQLTITTGTCVNTQTIQVKVNDAVGLKEAEMMPFVAAVVPNPMTNGGTLELQVIKTGQVQAVLYNQLGQEVKVLSSGTLDAGDHKFQISDLEAGVYFVKINNGSQDKVIRIVSVK